MAAATAAGLKATFDSWSLQNTRDPAVIRATSGVSGANKPHGLLLTSTPATPLAVTVKYFYII